MKKAKTQSIETHHNKNELSALPISTLNCPDCTQPLWFKQIHGIRLIENGLLEAICNTCNKYYYVKAKSIN